MHLARRSLLVVAAISFLGLLFFPVWFHVQRIYCFAPLLIVIYYQRTYKYSLWASVISGAIVDSFSVHPFFGLHALTYCLVTLVLYRQKQYFFADRLSTLPLMAFFFSLLATATLLIFALVLEGKPYFFRSFFYTDFLVMPLCDALYAFLFFVLPSFFFKRIRRMEAR